MDIHKKKKVYQQWGLKHNLKVFLLLEMAILILFFLNQNPCKPWAAVDIVENAILARLSKWLVKD